eukprot:9503245-Lingulodinium_polyedra.AAC.1
MFYAKANRMAIRRRHGDKRQLFQFGTNDMSRAELDEVADFVIASLEGGSMTVDAARDEARARCQ